jgi:hypothetical protein
VQVLCTEKIQGIVGTIFAKINIEQQKLVIPISISLCNRCLVGPPKSHSTFKNISASSLARSFSTPQHDVKCHVGKQRSTPPPPAQKLKEKHAHQHNVQMFSEPSGENY